MWNLIFDDILLCLNYLPISLLIGVGLSAVYYGFEYLIGKKTIVKHSIASVNVILRVCLITYLLIILQIVFLSRESGSRDGIDLRIFGTLTGNVRGDSYVLENVLLFIPLGILIPSVLNKFRSFHNSILFGFLLSCFIEGAQLLSKRGYCQIDDIIMNTVGCGIGFLVWKVVEYYYTRITLPDRTNL